MKAFVSFPELEEIIKERTHKTVGLSYADKPDTICLEYTVNVKVPLLGTKSKTIHIFLTVNKVSSMDVEITYALARGLDFMLDVVTKMLNGFISQTDLVSLGNNPNNLILHCDHIARRAGVENVDKFRTHVRVNTIHVLKEGIEVDFSLKV